MVTYIRAMQLVRSYNSRLIEIGSIDGLTPFIRELHYELARTALDRSARGFQSDSASYARWNLPPVVRSNVVSLLQDPSSGTLQA